MPSTVHVETVWLVSLAIAAVFCIVYPFVLAIIAGRRLQVSWRYFGWGALIFFVFQMITRVPLVLVLQNALAKQLAASPTLRLTWLVILAVTAGLFEEFGRYVAYRWLMRHEEKTWSKAVMYGIGHGGLESILLVGGLRVLTLLNIVVLTTMNLNTLPPAQHEAVVQQFAAINAQPGWFPLLGAWERLWLLPVQIGLSVIVVQVFRRGNIGWLWLAILAHAVVDFTTVEVGQVLRPGISTSLIQEGIVLVFGLLALWVIWVLRDRPAVTETSGEPAPGPAVS
ncbi:MAG: YhfC family intramembrane metalloprotease [Ktedonobacteraceae bacterium]|nr:YhfC family intramembrane metalloprotease [Ktedonobacteraceae bacterium]